MQLDHDTFAIREIGDGTTITDRYAGCDRGGAAFSDTGVSGFLPGQYSNRRADIHEKAKT
jgi:hypothetical protein